MKNNLKKKLALIEAVDRKLEMHKKASSVMDEIGGIGGGTMGGLVGMTTGAMLANKLGGKYKLMAALLGGIGGGVTGAIGGSNLGYAMARNRRQKDYREILEDAEINRRKALLDAIAMRAFKTSGVVPPTPMRPSLQG